MRATTTLHKHIVAGIGQRVALLRSAHGHSQEKLAELLRVDRATISSVESERTLISLPAVVMIAQFYEAQLDWLARGNGYIFHPRSSGLRVLGGHAFECRAATRLAAATRHPMPFCQLEWNEAFGWLFEGQDELLVISLDDDTMLHKWRDLCDLLGAGHQFKGFAEVSENETTTLHTYSSKELQVDTKTIQSFRNTLLYLFNTAGERQSSISSVRGLDLDVLSRVEGFVSAVEYLLRPGQRPLLEEALNKLARSDTTDATSAGTSRRRLTDHGDPRRVLMAIINWLNVHNPTLLAKLENELQVQPFSASKYSKEKKVEPSRRR